MKTPVIAIIGAGNMGASLTGGLINNGHPVDHIIATDPSPEKRQHLTHTYGIQTLDDNATAIKQADVVIFAVKPQLFETIALPLSRLITERQPLVISIAAGIRASSIAKWLGGHAAIVRVMPNTPALIGAGASALFATPSVSTEQHNIAESIMRAVGITVWVKEESEMDTVTALSGSGPAYFFLILEALQQGAEELGLSAETAQMLAQQTALGAALMAIDSTHSPAELRQHVTSPGGTTEAAIAVLEKNHLREILKQALQAAKNRSVELANLLGEKS